METATLIRANLNNDIGFVTDNKLVLHSGKDSNVIRFSEIKKINLTKKRRFEVNAVLFLSAISINLYLFPNTRTEPFVRQISVAFTIIALLLGIFYKSYRYQLLIALKDGKSYIIRKSGFQKTEIKSFYYSIRKKLRNSKLED